MQYTASTTLCVALLLTWLGCGCSRPQSVSASPREIEGLIGLWNKAWLEKDAATIEKQMAPDFLVVMPDGQVLKRDVMLAIARSPGYQLKESTRTELDIKAVSADTVAVVHRWQAAGVFDGKAEKADVRCTMIYNRKGGVWQAALEQCSPIAGNRR